MQANFVAMPSGPAADFLKFCERNPRACPILDVTAPGDPVPRAIAPDADLRTDIPKYRVWEHGRLTEEITDIRRYWTDDTVAFLIGCSFSWEGVLEDAGLCPRHVTEEKNVPMYVTAVENEASGCFRGKLVVSMRPYSPSDAARAEVIRAYSFMSRKGVR